MRKLHLIVAFDNIRKLGKSAHHHHSVSTKPEKRNHIVIPEKFQDVRFSKPRCSNPSIAPQIHAEIGKFGISVAPSSGTSIRTPPGKFETFNPLLLLQESLPRCMGARLLNFSLGVSCPLCGRDHNLSTQQHWKVRDLQA